MISKSKSRIVAFFLLSVIYVTSCNVEEIAPSKRNGTITLVLDLMEISDPEARIITSRIENIDQLYLTIETKDRKSTHLTRSATNFSLKDQTLVVEEIALPPAEYQVSEILVKDYTGDIIYASPLGSSKISASASTSLPQHFNVVPDKEDQIVAAAVSTLGHTPKDFGFEGPDILFKDEVACDGGAHEGDVRLTSQEEINEFASRCFTGINGSLRIDIYNKPMDLSPLNSLRFIEEGLSIREHEKRPEWHDMDKNYLVSLHGLHNVEYIGAIMLNDLTSIETLEGLKGLKEVRDIHLADLPKLKNMKGLENLAKCRMLRINRCEGLVDLKGLDKIEEFTLQLNSNDALANLHGMPNLKHLTQLSLYQNKKIASLSELFDKNPLSIGAFSLTDSNLEDLNGLFSENLKITKSLGFNNNSQLSSLEGLWLAEEGMEFIIIDRHKKLADISALSKVRSVDVLKIDLNEMLENLDGLENILEFSHSASYKLVQVTQNPLLKDLCGMVPLLSNHPTVTYKVEENAHNPTVSDIIDGKCSI